MLKLDFHPSGRHFLQIPGPSPVPDRILRAMSLPTIDIVARNLVPLALNYCVRPGRFSRQNSR